MPSNLSKLLLKLQSSLEIVFFLVESQSDAINHIHQIEHQFSLLLWKPMHFFKTLESNYSKVSFTRFPKGTRKNTYNWIKHIIEYVKSCTVFPPGKKGDWWRTCCKWSRERGRFSGDSSEESPLSSLITVSPGRLKSPASSFLTCCSPRSRMRRAWAASLLSTKSAHCLSFEQQSRHTTFGRASEGCNWKQAFRFS